MSKTITQLDDVIDLDVPLSADDYLVGARAGKTFKYRLITLRTLLPQATRESLDIDNTDNTSDLNKPLSLATSQALLSKAPEVHQHDVTDITNLDVIRPNVIFLEPDW